jgi:hypothetical protein
MKQIGATPTTFSYDEHTKELKEKFARLIRKLGPKNTKGCKRYEHEVNFAYALNALEQGPSYLRGKLFEQANDVANSLVSYLKTVSKSEEETQVKQEETPA